MVSVRPSGWLISARVLTLTLFCSFANAQSASPNGAFGFLINTAFNSSPDSTGIALLGVLNFDGAGNVSGTYTYEVDARSVRPVKTTRGGFTGTYSSNSDGAGSVSMALDMGIRFQFAMSIADSGQSLRLVATDYQLTPEICSCIVAGMSMSGIARATPSASVVAFGKNRNAMDAGQRGSRPIGRMEDQPPFALNGAYAILFNNSPNVNASVGVIKFDGAGNVTLTETFVSASDDKGVASMPFDGTQPGTYTINPDGTGTMNLVAVPDVSNARSFAFVITDNGSGFFLVQLDRGGSGVTTGSARLQ